MAPCSKRRAALLGRAKAVRTQPGTGRFPHSWSRPAEALLSRSRRARVAPAMPKTRRHGRKTIRYYRPNGLNRWSKARLRARHVRSFTAMIRDITGRKPESVTWDNWTGPAGKPPGDGRGGCDLTLLAGATAGKAAHHQRRLWQANSAEGRRTFAGCHSLLVRADCACELHLAAGYSRHDLRHTAAD